MSNSETEFKFATCDIGIACHTDAGPGRIILAAHWPEEEKLKEFGWKVEDGKKTCSRCVFVVD